MQIIKTSLTLLGAALLTPLATAAEYQSIFYFQNELSEPVGIGTMSFDGAAPGDGTYATELFTNLTFDFQFHPFFTDLGTFSEADLVSSWDSFSIRLIGDTFQFTGPGSGIYGASAEFVNSGGDYLAFSPSSVPMFAFVVFIDGMPSGPEAEPDILGVYGAISAVPEPSSAATLAGAAALGLVGLRRRRRA